jgi:hypothetical protein
MARFEDRPGGAAGRRDGVVSQRGGIAGFGPECFFSRRCPFSFVFGISRGEDASKRDQSIRTIGLIEAALINESIATR